MMIKTYGYLSIILTLLINTDVIFAANENYLLFLPNTFLSDGENKIGVLSTVDLALYIQTKHNPSNLTVDSQNYLVGGNKYSLISYEFPFIVEAVKSNDFSINVKADLFPRQSGSIPNVKGKFINEIREISVKLSNYFIFAESNKPLYKPGELVRFRFFPFYPTTLQRSPPQLSNGRFVILKDENSKYRLEQNKQKDGNTFKEIIVENPEGIRREQWNDVSLDKAMNLTLQLSKDPVFGKWKIQGKFLDQSETIYFTVKRYVMPRFISEIKQTKEVMYSNKLLEFQVCSKYSTGKAMSAEIVGKVCFNDKNCQLFQTIIKDGAYCTDIKLEMKKFFRKTKYYYGSFSINVTVTEEGTTLSVKKTIDRIVLERTPFKLSWEGKNYFKPGLPYFGRVKVERHNGEPLSNANITVSSFDYSSYKNMFGFQLNYTSDENGLINFVIPNLPASNSLTVKVFGSDKLESQHMYQQVLYERLYKWESVENKYLQIVSPVKYQYDKNKCVNKIQLKFLSNQKLESPDVFSVIYSRGKIIMFSNLEFQQISCIKSRDDYLGHYDCLGNSQIKCKPGWFGANCNQPICNDCQNGICITPNECHCKAGFSGKICDICNIRPGCKHGVCRYGDDCFCDIGWRGYLCDYKSPKSHFYPRPASAKSNVTTTKPIETNEKTKGKLSLFEYTGTLDNFEMSQYWPDLHLTVAYISGHNSELIVDAMELDMMSNDDQNSPEISQEHCIMDPSRFNVSRKEARPGDQLTMNLNSCGTKCESQSCAVRIIDSAIEQFGSSSSANLKYLIDQLEKFTHSAISQRQTYSKSCLDNVTDHGNSQRLAGTSIRVLPWMYSDGYDSQRILEDAGLQVISSLRTVSKKCEAPRILYSQQPMAFNNINPIARDEEMGGVVEDAKVQTRVDIKKKIKTRIRTLFPEAWLFEYYPNSTRTQWNYTVPDSITTWNIAAYCINSQSGLYISPSRQLTVLLPFYADIYLPYSIKRGEIMKMPVKLFSYLSSEQCFEVQVTLKVNAQELSVIGASRFTACLCGQQNKKFYFKLSATQLGKLNVTILSKSQSSSFCENSPSKQTNANMMHEYSDGIMRQLLVVPEGSSNETSFSQLLCANSTKDHDGSIGVKSEYSLPPGEIIVAGSLRNYLVYNGDIMGQTLDNLDRLVIMPYGCGEQNMVALVPSIYTIQYLESIGKQTQTKKDKELILLAGKYIRQGFQRQLKYRHSDGSFSAFGQTNKDIRGSTWLTAFVAQSFRLANRFIDLDVSVVDKADEYLLSMQDQADGCFNEAGKLFSNVMSGGVGSKSDITDRGLLTAYVLLSLANSSKLTSHKTNLAVECIRRGLVSNNYTDNYRMALSSYAVSLTMKVLPEFMSELKSKLLAAATNQGSRNRFWKSNRPMEKYYYSPSAVIETTGYAYLGLDQLGESMTESLPTIYWLCSQRNSLGGYYSTQDTIVALKALSNFARKSGAGNFQQIKFTAKLHWSNTTHTNQIESYTNEIPAVQRLVTRKVAVSSTNISYISFHASGKGCLSIQLQSLYNEYRDYTSFKTFSMSMTQQKNSFDRSNCSEVSMKLCSGYLRDDVSSGMILITINLPSGFILTTTQRNLLVSQLVTPLNKIEFESDRIMLYYDGFSYRDVGTQRCVDLEMTQNINITQLKPAYIRIMDYYQPEKYLDITYSLANCSKSKPTPTYQPPVPKCPLCHPQKQLSLLESLNRLCFGPTASILVLNKTHGNLNNYYVPHSDLYYEYQVKLAPNNCSCYSLSPALIIPDKSSYRYTVRVNNDTLEFNNATLLLNQSQFLPIIQKTNIHLQCQPANNLWRLMQRVLSVNEYSITNTTIALWKDICPDYINQANYYNKVQNITEFMCSAVNNQLNSTNQSIWSIQLVKINHPVVTVNLTNLANTSQWILTNATLVQGDIALKQCWSFIRLFNTTAVTTATKLNLVIPRQQLQSLKISNGNVRQSFVWDSKFSLVDDEVLYSRKYYKCQ